MNVDTLIIGLIACVFGLIGLIVKSNGRDYPKKSYTGAKFLWSIYLLLGVGVFLVIWSFF
jgi:hypothetical protein